MTLFGQQPLMALSLDGALAIDGAPETRSVRRNVMSERDDERLTVNSGSTTSLRDDDRQDPLDPAAQVPAEIPAGFDRRRFIMRSAVISAAAVLTGCTRPETESKAPAPTPAAASARQPQRCRCPPT